MIACTGPALLGSGGFGLAAAKDEAAVWTRRARAFGKAGDAEGELAAWKRVLELGGDDAGAAAEVVRVLTKSGRFPETVPYLRRLAKAEPAETAHWKALAKIFAGLGDTDGEIEAWTQLLALRGEDPSIHTKLARVMLSGGRFAEAVPHLVALARPEPEGAAAGRPFAGHALSLAHVFSVHPWAGLLPQARAAAAARGDRQGEILVRLLDDIETVQGPLIQLAGQFLEGAPEEGVFAAAQAVVGALEDLAPAADDPELAELQGGVRLALWSQLSLGLMEHDADMAEILVLERWLEHSGAAPWVRRRLARLLARQGRAEDAGRSLGAEPADSLNTAPRASPEGEPLAGRVLVLPHAQKTGGSSVKSGLTVALGRPAVDGAAFQAVVAAIGSMAPAERRAARILTGHFNFDQAEDALVPMLGLEPLYVGVVRDPAARMKSIFRYMGRSRDAGARSQMLRVEFDDDLDVVVRRWLEARSEWAGWRNSQCRTICGAPGADEAIRTVESRYLAACITPSVNALVGAVARGLGRPAPHPMHEKRTGSQDLELDPRLETRLREHHREDQRLFEWVEANEARLLERCEARLARLAPAP